MSIYLLVLEMKKLLKNLDGCLEKAVAHATAKRVDPDVLLGTRLALDMFPLVRQIQNACDQAKWAAARSAGKQAPAHPDDEKTVADCRKRIATVIEYLDGFRAADFDGVAERRVALPRWEGKSMSATDYVIEHAMPNFFFHFTMAYALLRHNGVDIGKRDYLGPVNMK